MGFVGNYAPCGLSPQMYDMPVIHTNRTAPKHRPIHYRAENEARTRDPQLGKLMLYQLSYFRISPSSDCEGKGTIIFQTNVRNE